MSRVTDCCGCFAKRSERIAPIGWIVQKTVPQSWKGIQDLIFAKEFHTVHPIYRFHLSEFYSLEKKKNEWKIKRTNFSSKERTLIKISNHLGRIYQSISNSSIFDGIKNANEWELENLTLRYFCNLTLPFSPVTSSKHLFTPSNTIGYTFETFWARKEGEERGIRVGVIKKWWEASFAFDSIRFGGKKGIEREGKKLFRNGNNGGWNAFLSFEKCNRKKREWTTISNNHFQERRYPLVNIPQRFLHRCKNCSTSWNRVSKRSPSETESPVI